MDDLRPHHAHTARLAGRQVGSGLVAAFLAAGEGVTHGMKERRSEKNVGHAMRVAAYRARAERGEPLFQENDVLS